MNPDLKAKLDATVKAATTLIKQSDRMKRILADVEKREKEELAAQSSTLKGMTAPED